MPNFELMYDELMLPKVGSRCVTLTYYFFLRYVLTSTCLWSYVYIGGCKLATLSSAVWPQWRPSRWPGSGQDPSNTMPPGQSPWKKIFLLLIGYLSCHTLRPLAGRSGQVSRPGLQSSTHHLPRQPGLSSSVSPIQIEFIYPQLQKIGNCGLLSRRLISFHGFDGTNVESKLNSLNGMW